MEPAAQTSNSGGVAWAPADERGRLAEAVGMDKGQISRALAGLVSRKLVSAVNPRDNREVLVCLTRTGLVAHDAMVAGALERNQRLLEHGQGGTGFWSYRSSDRYRRQMLTLKKT